MTIKIEVIRGSTTYDLTDPSTFAMLGYEGTGMAPVRNVLQRSPFQDGATHVLRRLEARRVQLAIWAVAADVPTLMAANQTLLAAFKPTVAPFNLRVTHSSTDAVPVDVVRQLDCHYDGELSLGSQQHRGFSQVAGVTLMAPDPTWYDPTAVELNFTTAGGDGFTVPMPVPHFVGASIIGGTVTVTYAGTWKTYPIITVTGPIVDCVITNHTTDEKLDFTGQTLAAGEQYVIDLRPGYKTIRDENGDNALPNGILTADSDLGTWHIAADPEVANGENDISVAGTGTTGSTTVEFEYYNRYTGI
jgi:hypothetical protein